MENLWHVMADTAESLLPKAREMGTTGFVLEWRPGSEALTGYWNSVFHILSLYDWDPQLAKSGSEREASIKLRSALDSLCKRAAGEGLSVYLMGSEINLTEDMAALKPELKDPDGPEMYDFIKRRFEDILAGCPHLSGILLYLDEGNHVIMEMPGRSSRSERVKAVIQSGLQACEKLDRKLIVTTFALMPHQAEAITDALKSIPPSPNLVVYNYACPGDWGRIALKNPSVGNCGPHPEILVFDYCGEIWGQSVAPFIQARLIAERVAYAREHGARIYGLSGYITWGDLDGGAVYSGNAIGSVNEANVHVARRIAETGALEAKTFVREWAQATYGTELGNRLTPILLRQQDSHLAAWHILGFWYLEWPKSRLPNLNWFEYSLHWESLALWDESYRETERLIFNPTREFVEQRVIAEKDSAVSAAARDLEEITVLLDSAEKSDKLSRLLTLFRRELIMNKALRHYTAGFFYAKLATSGDEKAYDDTRVEIDKLVRIAAEVEDLHDRDFWILEPSRLRMAATELQEVLKTGKWPAEKAIREWNERLEKDTVSSLIMPP